MLNYLINITTSGRVAVLTKGNSGGVLHNRAPSLIGVHTELVCDIIVGVGAPQPTYKCVVTLIGPTQTSNLHLA